LTYRVGLIGLGLAVAPHLQSLADLGARARIAAAFSRSAGRRQAFAAQTGLPVTGDLDSLFASADIDVVAILTPPASHLELVQRAASAGKHILLEKPLDITTARSEALVETVEQAGVTAAIMLQHRFKPAAEVKDKWDLFTVSAPVPGANQSLETIAPTKEENNCTMPA